jgi:hypothetical protein
MTSPHELALAYDRYIAALWRGDEAAHTFASWLGRHWTDAGPAEPTDRPHAASAFARAGAGIRWYTRGTTIVGYVGTRYRGCYQVPVDASPPPIP